MLFLQPALFCLFTRFKGNRAHLSSEIITLFIFRNPILFHPKQSLPSYLSSGLNTSRSGVELNQLSCGRCSRKIMVMSRNTTETNSPRLTSKTIVERHATIQTKQSTRDNFHKRGISVTCKNSVLRLIMTMQANVAYTRSFKSCYNRNDSPSARVQVVVLPTRSQRIAGCW